MLIIFNADFKTPESFSTNKFDKNKGNWLKFEIASGVKFWIILYNSRESNVDVSCFLPTQAGSDRMWNVLK